MLLVIFLKLGQYLYFIDTHYNILKSFGEFFFENELSKGNSKQCSLDVMKKNRRIKMSNLLILRNISYIKSHNNEKTKLVVVVK